MTPVALQNISDRLRRKYGTTAAKNTYGSSLVAGDAYLVEWYDSDLGRVEVWNGTAWNNKDPIVSIAKNHWIAGDGGVVSDATATTCFIIGGFPTAYSSGYKNYIGSTSAVPDTVGHSTNWGADSGYPGGLTVCSILGGYDCVANQTGGVIVGANHSMLKYNLDGNGVIVGGSVCVMAGARGGIFSSRESEVGPATTFSGIYTSDDCEIQSGNFSSIISSYLSNANGSHNVIISGESCTIASTSSRNILGGNASTITGTTIYTIVVGLTCNANNAQHCIVVGSNLSTSHSYAEIIGSFGNTPATLSRTISAKINENNDCRTWDQLDYKRTTNATTTNTNLLGATLPSGKTTSGLLRITVIAEQDGSADGDNSGNYAIGTWIGDVMFRWDGTNGYLATSATTSGPSTGPSIDLAAIRDDITVAALPKIVINTGILRVQVTGHASKTINWAIKYDVLSTLVS